MNKHDSATVYTPASYSECPRIESQSTDKVLRRSCGFLHPSQATVKVIPQQCLLHRPSQFITHIIQHNITNKCSLLTQLTVLKKTVNMTLQTMHSVDCLLPVRETAATYMGSEALTCHVSVVIAFREGGLKRHKSQQ